MEVINKSLKHSMLSVPLIFKSGDILNLVYEDRGAHWKVRKFTGVCISYSKGVLPRCTLRNVFNGVAVELSFDIYSKNIISLKVSSKYKKISSSRAKLYYLRDKRLSESRI
jgi:ribosomal protein L19